MTRILIMGPPGAGKGTQAAAIAGRFDIPSISTGAIFRANVDAGTELGKTARRYLEAGEYVPDEITNEMVRDRISQSDCKSGFLLDGYPRTLDQVAALDAILASSGVSLDAVVSLEVDLQELVRRLLERAGVEERSDDTETVVRRRQEVYAEETAPLLAEYDARGLLLRVDGRETMARVSGRVFEALGIRV